MDVRLFVYKNNPKGVYFYAHKHIYVYVTSNIHRLRTPLYLQKKYFSISPSCLFKSATVSTEQ